MAQFRQLEPSEVERILAAFGVPGYRQHRPISAGTINTNVEAETAGARYFLRINEGKTIDDVRREAAIVAYAAARGVPTPAPLSVPSTGEPFFEWQGALVSLFPWVPGRTLSRPELTPRHGAAVGAALARLHQASAGFADHRPGRYEPDEIERRLARVAALGQPELGSAVAILEPELRLLARERRSGLPMGIIHGDLFVDNVLYDPDDGRLAALIDFEQASWGRLAYDLAVTALAFGYGRDGFRADVTRALIDSYVTVRPPSAEERAGFGAELRFAACRFAVTRITDVHLKRGEGAPPGKDFRRYLDRLAKVREHLAAGDALLAL
jgi:homoserine kinase type II